MKTFLKRIVNNSYYLKHLKGRTLDCYYSRNLKSQICHGRVKSYVVGQGNYLVSKEGSYLDKLKVKIRGNNNQILIGENVRIHRNCSIMIVGNNCKIQIGDDTSINKYSTLECNEDGSYIDIGKDRMFSNHIHIRTNDSHYIYKKGTSERLNPSKSVRIGDHVWIAAWVKILKGVKIGSGSVIGYNSIVTHDVEENSVAAGVPA